MAQGEIVWPISICAQEEVRGSLADARNLNNKLIEPAIFHPSHYHYCTLLSYLYTSAVESCNHLARLSNEISMSARQSCNLYDLSYILLVLTVFVFFFFYRVNVLEIHHSMIDF